MTLLFIIPTGWWPGRKCEVLRNREWLEWPTGRERSFRGRVASDASLLHLHVQTARVNPATRHDCFSQAKGQYFEWWHLIKNLFQITVKARRESGYQLLRRSVFLNNDNLTTVVTTGQKRCLLIIEQHWIFLTIIKNMPAIWIEYMLTWLELWIWLAEQNAIKIHNF